MWEILKVVSKGEYNYAVVPNHPNSTSNGYILEHRVVMENKLGRLLSANEVVHHKDEDKKNNSIENLEVMTKKEHCKLHATTGRSVLSLICAECGIEFEREVRQMYGKTQSFCSRKCNGRYQRKRQLNGEFK